MSYLNTSGIKEDAGFLPPIDKPVNDKPVPAELNKPETKPAGEVPGTAPSGYLADNRVVGDNELVSKRLTGLLQKDNPYIAQARNRANAFSNSRGMLNSTMAASSGESAAIERALPIAQGDANAYAKTASENMAATNLAKGQSSQLQNATDTTIRNNEGAIDRIDVQGQVDYNKLDIQGYNDLNKIEMDGYIKSGLIDQTSATRIDEIRASGFEEINKLKEQIGGTLKINYAKDFNGIVSSSETSIRDVLSSTSISGANKAPIVASIVANTKRNLQFVTSMYGVDDQLQANWELFG